MSGQQYILENNESNGKGKYYLNGRTHFATEMEANWKGNFRWQGVQRPYSAVDVVRLRGSVQIEHTLARLGASPRMSRLEPGRAVAESIDCNVITSYRLRGGP